MGVMGIALEKLESQLQPLLLVQQLPALHDAVADEVRRRAEFRDRFSATLTLLNDTVEPALLEESNRRVAWLSDRAPAVREWVHGRLPWMHDEMLSYSVAPISFDRHLPLAPECAAFVSLLTHYCC